MAASTSSSRSPSTSPDGRWWPSSRRGSTAGRTRSAGPSPWASELARVAVFSGPALRKNLKDSGAGAGLRYEFFPAAQAFSKTLDLPDFAGALVEIGARSGPAPLRTLRKALDARPVGSLSLRCDAAILRRSRELGYDFHRGSW